MDEMRLNEVIRVYRDRYLDILSRIWPTLGSNGFNELNQTVNFMTAYEAVAAKKGEKITTWYEFQIHKGEKKNNRMDGLILNHTSKELYLIEAKRFSKNKLDDKKQDLGKNLLRIEDLDGNRRFDTTFFKGNESIDGYTQYGVLLFDLWTEKSSQKDLLESWAAICQNPEWQKVTEFFKVSEDETAKHSSRAEMLPIFTEVNCADWEEKDYSYYLGCFVWMKKKPSTE